jgi:hypothetical protein
MWCIFIDRKSRYQYGIGGIASSRSAEMATAVTTAVVVAATAVAVAVAAAGAAMNWVGGRNDGSTRWWICCIGIMGLWGS